ncbi:MAG: DUF1465 family protein [Alphaproteobacteria bacterium]|jgi:regulator of CtrA degradation|nr:DUF1465 family protein [Alphaproteobacteria bacterium]
MTKTLLTLGALTGDAWVLDSREVHSMQSVFVDRLYNETMVLLEDARDYAAVGEPRDRHQLSRSDACLLTIESMRTTSRLVSVMAWVLARKAAEEEEAAAAAGHEPLMVNDHHVAPIDDPGNVLPMRFVRIARRAHDLFARVHRIDQVHC